LSNAIRGTVLVGRYRLQDRVHSNPDGSLWRALDDTLDRRVSIRVLRPAHPFAADVVDAARRAALIDDSRLVRVLDVGSDGDVAFVVSEWVEGDTLASLVERSPLAPPVVRRIVGEVAQGLEGAAARGLHHLRLTPRSVIVTRDGTVKIFGTAVEAAAAGLEPDHAASAGRTDATALVALLYSGLTGRWPLGDAGFPPAPRGEGGSPVPPADLVRDIPNDLDTLCVVTLGPADDGPRSPAEVVRELTPWPTVQEAPLRAAARRPAAQAPAGPLPADSPLKIRSRPTGKRPAGAPAAGAFTSPPPAAGRAPRRPANLFPSASFSTPDSTLVPPDQQPQSPPEARSNTSATLEPDPAPSAPVESLFTKNAAADVQTAPARPEPFEPREGRGDPAEPDERFEPGDSGERAAPPAFRAPPLAYAGNGPRPEEEPLLPWGPGWVARTTPPSESTGPFPIIIPPEAPPAEQSRMVLFIVGGVLLLGLVVAAFMLRDLGSSGSERVLPTGAGLPTASVAPPVEPTPGSPTTPAPSPSPSPSKPAVRVEIAAIRAIDPQGDGDEDTPSSPKAVDGDSSTYWSSKDYRTAAFGGLKKGVGLSLKLKRTAAVTSATVRVHGSGGSVQLRTASSPDLGSSTVVAKGDFRDGEITLKARNAKPSRYVILWFTDLPSVDGKYTIEVSEVQLK
jgi:hypothetical protein